MMMKKSTDKNVGKGKGLTNKNAPATQDELWKDMLRHEKYLNELWKLKWDFLLDLHPTFRDESIDRELEKQEKSLDLVKNRKLEKREYKIKQSPPISTKSSESIGWRSADLQNSFNLFPIKPFRPQKISFQGEQYGKYRIKKYLKEELEGKTKEENNPKELVLPTKHIIHNVKPLIC